MTHLYQHEFAAALHNPDSALAGGLLSRDNVNTARRMAVYRNNVMFSLIEALRTRYTASERIVGVEFFAAMARFYIWQNLPRSPVLFTYGDDFADFAAAFPPAADIPYLPDVMRIEAAHTRAYHARDAAALPAHHLAAVRSERLGDLQLDLLPGTEILRSPYPSHTIWAMNSDHLPLGPITDWHGECTLVARDGFDVATRRVSSDIAAFLSALIAGETIARAAARAASDADSFDLADAFRLLIHSGLIVAIRTLETTR